MVISVVHCFYFSLFPYTGSRISYQRTLERFLKLKSSTQYLNQFHSTHCIALPACLACSAAGRQELLGRALGDQPGYLGNELTSGPHSTYCPPKVP